MDMHEKIRRKAKERGIKLNALCARLGWHPNRISRWARGDIKICLDEVRAVASELRVSLAWLVDDDLPYEPAEGLSEVDELLLGLVRRLGHAKVLERLVSVTPQTAEGPHPLTTTYPEVSAPNAATQAYEQAQEELRKRSRRNRGSA